MNMNKLGIFLIASAVLLSACGQRSDDLAVDGIGQVDATGILLILIRLHWAPRCQTCWRFVLSVMSVTWIQAALM